MCLLIFKPAGKSIPYDHLAEADLSNPHGCGIAFADGKKVVIQKHPKWGCDEIAAALDKAENAPAIVHFRFATHGSLNQENTHPFPLPRNSAAAHNGIISTVKCLPDESDSRAYLRQHVSPLISRGVKVDTPGFLIEVERQIGAGNKIAFLDAKGNFGIANEKVGHWKDGVWYSNTTYQAPRSVYSGGKYGYFPKEDIFSQWVKTDVSELRCTVCEAHVTSKGFGKSLLIDPETGELICAGCAEMYR